MADIKLEANIDRALGPPPRSRSHISGSDGSGCQTPTTDRTRSSRYSASNVTGREDTTYMPTDIEQFTVRNVRIVADLISFRGPNSARDSTHDALSTGYGSTGHSEGVVSAVISSRRRTLSGASSSGKRGTVPKKKEGIPDEAAVINTYMEKRERTLASKKRYASKKRMDQRNDRLAARGFGPSKVAADESKTRSQETVDGDEDGDGDDETEEVEVEEEPQPMSLQDVPPNSSEGPKPKLRLKPLAKPGEPATGPENALPPSSPLSAVPTTSVSVSPSESMHPGPAFSSNTPGPINSTWWL
ncbi:hypothetical protein RSOL_225150, partial [Rhizoctonia solani AG-3 Rhs1AP]